MKILIIENVWMGGAKYRFFDKLLLTSFSILPTLYARQIAAITPKEHNVTVLNERYSKINFDEKYDIVNINFTTSTATRAYEIADIFRKKGVKVVLSGLHASALPEEAKQHADSVLLGRGEINWLKLLDDFKNDKLEPYYPSLDYNKSIKIPPVNINLPGFVMTGAIEASRGCPYRCEFCPESNIPGGGKFYTRPVDEVIDEIKSIPQKTIIFYDNSLTINKKYTKSLFKKMIGLNKKFFCNGNSDVLANDKELVKLSKEAGCVSWLIGFESVSQKTIDAIGKKTNKIEEYSQAVENIHDNRMAVIGDFMFGFDTDTPEIFNETLKIIKQLKIDIADFCILTPFPGTPIYNRLDKEGRILTKDWSQYNLKNVVFVPKNITSDDLALGLRRMYKEFYSTGYTVKRIIRGLKLGVYPFFFILARNAVANMNSRLIKIKV
ncbi:MAG TPA: radical SAM protein [Candidatus Lokiarchaeia archaeon]